MCTAVNYVNGDHYFGRNLDLEASYREEVTITPRNYPFSFWNKSDSNHHYAMIGMATIQNHYPLYYEASNERGLSMAALYFPKNAVYLPEMDGKDNIAPYEFIPWILSQCSNVAEAQKRLEQTNLVDIPFSTACPNQPLHWLISDASSSLVVEPTADGLKLYGNPVGVLTNNPPFNYHLYHLQEYQNLTNFEQGDNLSKGMGAVGLPGDFSSASRFVKAEFVRRHSVSDGSEASNVSQMFHILSSVAVPRGSVKVADDVYETTLYSSCCNTSKGIYYYTTYDNSRITEVKLNNTDLFGQRLISYPIRTAADFLLENG